ncbi:MAG TPA: ABC transporter permease [Candidatus Krumholzibacteriaceae bacterium]|jgi:ABC-2 type transport system permease protein|nr:ABC transporter permease [Candidatus Krumholzibacteriaceae bacterium]
MSAKALMSNSFRIAWKDLMELFRNRLGLIMLILMPIFMMGMVGFIFPSNNSLNHVAVGLANQDAGFGGYTNGSQAFLTALNQINDQTHMLDITNATDLAGLKESVQKGNIQGGIVIPSNFTQCIMTGQQGTLIIVTDNSNPQVSAAMQGALTAVFQQMGTIFAEAKVMKLNSTINETNVLAIVQPYKIQVEGVVTGHSSYFDFIAPGIMAMTVMMSVMTGLPAAISQEKEVGTLDGMMVAPINRLSIITGKTLAQTARGLLQGVLILILASLLFGVSIQGSILLVFALLLLGVFSFVGLGVVLTSFAKDQETAMMVMMTLMFPMMFLSGVFFPVQQMPWYMQDISKVLPLTYAADALRKVMVLGAGIPQITTELGVLIVFGVVMIAIAVPVFKRAMTR